MFIFFKLYDDKIFYFAGFDEDYNLLISCNYDECFHFNLINNNMFVLHLLKKFGFQISFELD